MNNPLLTAVPTPVLGSDPKVHDVEIRMILTCECRPTIPLILRGIGDKVVCPDCQRSFVVGVVHFDRRESVTDIGFNVGIGHPTIVRPS